MSVAKVARRRQFPTSAVVVRGVAVPDVHGIPSSGVPAPRLTSRILTRSDAIGRLKHFCGLPTCSASSTYLRDTKICNNISSRLEC